MAVGFRFDLRGGLAILVLSSMWCDAILTNKPDDCGSSTCCNVTSQVGKLTNEVNDMKIYMAQMVQQLNRIENKFALDCSDIQLTFGRKLSGVYTVYLYINGIHRPVDVYCDMTTDGGRWTVFQRRKDGSVDFYRNWSNYSSGFGSLTGEFWLGNDNIHSLTTNKVYELRVDLGDFLGNTRYAVYSNFKVGGADVKYRLVSLGTYNGTAGDSMSRRHEGQQFSTFDQDNDVWGGSCAMSYKGAWWYDACHVSNLNGPYLRGNHTSYADGVEWYYWTGYYYSLRFTEMKIRPAGV